MDLLIDTNVLIDVLTTRKPYFDASKAVYDLCMDRTHTGYLAAHTITNMNYILRKVFTDEDRRWTLLALIHAFTVVGIDDRKLVSALHRYDFKDFEDCLQDECAQQIKADFIITRDVADYKDSFVKAITPEKFLELVG